MAKKTAKKVASKKNPSPKKAAKASAKPSKPVKKKVVKKVEPTPTAPKKKAPVKRVRTPKEVRLKAFWGVFNQSMRRVALFEYTERKQADKKAAELTKSGKSPHFVQPVKEVIEG